MENHSPLFHFPHPLIFSPTVLYLLPHNHSIFPGKILWSGKFYGCGEAGKGLLGEKGVGKMKKGENGFPLLIFSPNPQFLYFFPSSQFSP